MLSKLLLSQHPQKIGFVISWWVPRQNLILSIIARIPPQHPLTTIYFFSSSQTHPNHSLSLSLSHTYMFPSMASLIQFLLLIVYLTHKSQLSSSDFSLTKCSSSSHHQRCYNPPICVQNSSWHSSCSHQSCSWSWRSIYLDWLCLDTRVIVYPSDPQSLNQVLKSQNPWHWEQVLPFSQAATAP